MDNEKLKKDFLAYITNMNEGEDKDLLTVVYRYLQALEVNNERFHSVKLYYSYIHELLG